MKKLFDKILISICVTLLTLITNTTHFVVIPLLLFIIASCINSLFKNEIILCFEIVVASVFSCFFDVAICFLPLLIYDFNFKKTYSLTTICTLVPLFVNFDAQVFICFCILTAFAILSAHNTLFIENLRKTHYTYVENSQEKTSLLVRTNQEIIKNQLYKIQSIKLKERNRIACDIHDNVGHILSRSILLTGAIISQENDQNKKALLTSLRENLQTAMTSIRESVEGIHQEIFDLEKELYVLCDNFKFCKCDIEFNIKNYVQTNIAQSFFQIAKECLTNISKHSNATSAKITLNEHPALFQIVVHDNGTTANSNSLTHHIGLKSIESRAKELNGNFYINTSKGFKVFVSVPKEII